MATMRALFLLFISYHINVSLSDSCNCAGLNKDDCDSNIACQFKSHRDGICRSVAWFECENDGECTDNRDPITGEEDPDWPYDCDEGNADAAMQPYPMPTKRPMDLDSDSTTTQQPLFSTTASSTMTCADHGITQNATCVCIVNDAAVCYDSADGDCEDGPDIFCANGGVCCCGSCSNKAGGKAMGPPKDGGGDGGSDKMKGPPPKDGDDDKKAGPPKNAPPGGSPKGPAGPPGSNGEQVRISRYYVV